MFPSIGVFLSASDPIDPAWNDDAYRAGQILAEAKMPVIYGGASTGMMGRLADGALDAGGDVVAIISQAFLERGWAHPRITDLRVEPTLLQRKQALVDEPDGFLILPGGLGTLAEVVQVLSEQQARTEGNKPVVFAGPAEFWQPLLALIDQYAQHGLLRRSLFYRLVDDLTEVPSAFELLFIEHRAAMAAEPPALEAIELGARVGLFGGSFNPPTIAHLDIARQAADELGLDQVIFIPVGQHSSKQLDQDPGGYARLAMVEAALDDHRFIACDFHVATDGTSYMADALEWFAGRHPETRFWTVFGGDVAASLLDWPGHERILAASTVAVIERDDEQGLETLRERFSGVDNVVYLRSSRTVSSTLVRDNIDRRLPISPLVPPAVADAIYGLRFYRAPYCEQRVATCDPRWLESFAARARIARDVR